MTQPFTKSTFSQCCQNPIQLKLTNFNNFNNFNNNCLIFKFHLTAALPLRLYFYYGNFIAFRFAYFAHNKQNFVSIPEIVYIYRLY